MVSLLSACTSLSPRSATVWRAAPPATYRHVIWIWMENHTWPQVLANRGAAAYEIGLAARCATDTQYHSIGSPSLPNYTCSAKSEVPVEPPGATTRTWRNRASCSPAAATL